MAIQTGVAVSAETFLAAGWTLQAEGEEDTWERWKKSNEKVLVNRSQSKLDVAAEWCNITVDIPKVWQIRMKKG